MLIATKGSKIDISSEKKTEEIAKKSLTIAGDICGFTNHSHTIETIDY